MRVSGKGRPFLLLTILLEISVSHGRDVPPGDGQLTEAPRLIDGGIDESGLEFRYLGQPAQGGKIILTASNGFFTPKTCRAEGQSSLLKVGDDELIQPNFSHLNWTANPGSLRWHLLVAKPGSVRFNVHLEPANNGRKISVIFAGQERIVSASEGSSRSPQPWNLEFEAPQPGEYALSLAAPDPDGERIGNLHRIDAFGPAVDGAHLLRVRWRPAAAHGGYDTRRVEGVKLLVFTSQSDSPGSHYSPITTPFGYYGTGFDAGGKSTGFLNFSMWGNDRAAGDLKQMPHLLGLGSPEGEFSGFGHEGSGVKPRGWDPMPDQPKLVVQALRVEPGELYDSYFGYYFDHPTGQWKFYGAGNKWHGGQSVEHLKLGSFCEVPGPPQSQRTGDVYREVRRRAWAHDGRGWVSVESYLPGGSGSKSEEPVNKRWYTNEAGEYVMGCGGVRLYRHDPSRVVPAKATDELPSFLTDPSIENVFRLPVEYGAIQATEVHPDRALIEFDIVSGNELTGALLYHGKRDALTFAPRQLHGTERKSELSQAVNSMSWEEVTELRNVKVGVNRVTIENLVPDTKYYFRVLTDTSDSRVWNGQSLTFGTPAKGAAAIRNEPITGTAPIRPVAPGMSLEAEPFRTWAYSINGSRREIRGRLSGIAGDKIQIERESDGKKGTMELRWFSEADREYVGRRTKAPNTR